MPTLFAPLIARLDSAYRDRLATITVLFLLFIPLNIVKVLWFPAPFSAARVCTNLIVAIAAAIALRAVLNGKLAAAGSGLALGLVILTNTIVLLIGTQYQPEQPLSVGIQVFAFDLVFLLFAIVFASRQASAAVFAIMATGHVEF